MIPFYPHRQPDWSRARQLVASLEGSLEYLLPEDRSDARLAGCSLVSIKALAEHRGITTLYGGRR